MTMPNFDFLPRDIPTTDMLDFWNRMYEIDRKFYEDVRQWGIEFAEQQRQFNLQQLAREGEMTGVYGGQPTMDARRFLMEARNNPDILGSIYASQGLPYGANMQSETGIPGYVPPYYGEPQGTIGLPPQGGTPPGEMGGPDQWANPDMWGQVYNDIPAGYTYLPKAGGLVPEGTQVDPQTGMPIGNVSVTPWTGGYNTLLQGRPGDPSGPGGYDSGFMAGDEWWRYQQYPQPNPYKGAPTPTYPGGYPTGGQAPGADELAYRGNYEDWLNLFMNTRSGCQYWTPPSYSGGTPSGGAPAPGGGVSIDQARAELIKAGGGAGWNEGKYGPGTPGFKNRWETASPSEVAAQYAALTSKQVAGFNMMTGQVPHTPFEQLDPQEQEALKYVFANRPDIQEHFRNNPGGYDSGGAGTTPEQQMALWRHWAPQEVRQSGGLLSYAKNLGWGGGAPTGGGGDDQFITDPGYVAPNPADRWKRVTTPGTPGESSWYGFEPWLGGGYGDRYSQLMNSPFVQALQGFTSGSPQGQGYGSDPNVSVPQSNQIPFNWFQGLSPDEQAVTRSFYPGLTDEAFREPFANTIESLSGAPPSVNYRA